MTDDLPDVAAQSCPYCEVEARLVERTVRFRRGRRVLSVEVREWECPNACAGPDGERPFRFQDPALMRHNEQVARAAWLQRYGEPMPARRLPGRKTTAHRRVRVPVLLTTEEVARLDRLRGSMSRSAYLRRALDGEAG